MSVRSRLVQLLARIVVSRPPRWRSRPGGPLPRGRACKATVSGRAIATAATSFVAGVFALPAFAFVETERVSVATDGAQANGQTSLFWRAAISGSGRFVAFDSDATNLVAGDTSSSADAFVRDRDADGDGLFDEAGAVKTVRVSVSTSGAEGNGWTFYGTSISGAGRAVAFVSASSNLVGGDVNETLDVFVRDRDVDRDRVFDERGAVRTARVSVSRTGVEANGESGIPVISANGRFIVFASMATNLVGSDGNGAWDVFVRDRDADRDRVFDEPGAVRTRRLSLSTIGAEGNGNSEPAGISRNGRFVAFHSLASNLAADDTNGVWDVFVRDRDTDRDGVFDERGAVKTVRVSLSSNGGEADGASMSPAVSATGRFVAFQSSATNLVAADTNGFDDVFVRDRDSDGDGIFDERGAVATFRVSLSTSDTQAIWWSAGPSISASGRYVGFASGADNLVADDTNGATDGFVRDRDADGDGIFDERGAVATLRVSVAQGGAEAAGYSSEVELSANGRWAAFASGANNIVEPDLKLWNTDVFVRGPLR